jgi:hypothetical protein
MRDDADVDPRGRASARTGAARMRHALLSAAALRGRTRARRIELRGKVCGCGQARRRADGPCPPMSPVAGSPSLACPIAGRASAAADATASGHRRTAAAADGPCCAPRAHVRARPLRFVRARVSCERQRSRRPAWRCPSSRGGSAVAVGAAAVGSGMSPLDTAPGPLWCVMWAVDCTN